MERHDRPNGLPNGALASSSRPDARNYVGIIRFDNFNNYDCDLSLWTFGH